MSVMETAAIGPPGSTESLPLVFTVIKFIYPTQLDVVCSASRPYGLLGYGDVGIPGLLVTLGLKHDLQFRRGKCFKIYYATAGIGEWGVFRGWPIIEALCGFVVEGVLRLNMCRKRVIELGVTMCMNNFVHL